MAQPKLGAIDIQGLKAVKRAFKELEPAVARKVIRKAERKAANLFRSEILAHVPVDSGKLKKTVKVRSSKGPRGAKRGTVSLAILVGEAGQQGDGEEGIKRAWYGYLQEKGYHTGGKRIRRGGKTMGYTPLRGRTVRLIPGKHFTRNALRSKEADARQLLATEIAAGIEREAAALDRGK